MIFEKLTIQNFLSIKNIKLDLNDLGLVLLKGKNKDNESLNNNGAGKSSIIEALVYCLYGRTLRGLKGDAIVNNVIGKNTKVWLDLIDDNGDKYRIARYRKHNVNKNKSCLYRNSKDITPKSEADFNDYVANLLQADYLTFTSSLLYSAESFKFTSATDAEMKSTFDVMLGLDVYQRCLDITKTQLKEINYSIYNTTHSIEQNDQKLQKLLEDINQTELKRKQHAEDTQAKKQDLQDKIHSLEVEGENFFNQLKTAQDNLEIVKSEKEKAEKALAEKRESMGTINQLKSSIQDLEDDLQTHTRNYKKSKLAIADYTDSETTLNTKIEKCNANIIKYAKASAELDKTVGTPCPTCGQPLIRESIEPAKQEYDNQILEQQELKQKYEDTLSTIKTNKASENVNLSAYLAKQTATYTELENLKGLLEKSKSVTDELAECENVLDVTRDLLSKATVGVNSVLSKIDNQSKLIETTKGLLEEISDSNPYDDILNTYHDEVQSITKDTKDLQDSIQNKLDDKEILEFWQKAYSNQGIKSLVLDDITPFLNRRANKYLSRLSSGHIEVKFSTQSTLKSGEVREKFGIEVFNSDGGSEYSANSGGERKRVDLAINLALQDLVASRSSKRINIAIFDEIFDALDECGVEKVIELLQELSDEKSTILVVSHNQHLQSYFSNVITVVKQGGLSTLQDTDDDSEQETLEE